MLNFFENNFNILICSQLFCVFSFVNEAFSLVKINQKKNAHESLRQNCHLEKMRTLFCLKVTKSHLCTLVKVFCIFHLNRKSELQTLCGYRYEIMRYKLSFQRHFYRRIEIFLGKIQDELNIERLSRNKTIYFFKKNTTSKINTFVLVLN